MACAPDGERFSAGGERVARVPRLALPSPGRRPGVQPQVGEDLLDPRPLPDRRDDLQLPGAAARAAPQVDVEHALEQPRPADVLRPRLHGLRVAADLACGVGSRFASRRTPSPRRVSIFISRAMTVCSSA